MKPILVTTQHRGVFAGLVEDDADLSARTLSLKEARMLINWRNGKGVMSMASEGPVKDCRVSAAADIPVLHDVTAVFDITAEAWAVWTSAKTGVQL